MNKAYCYQRLGLRSEKVRLELSVLGCPVDMPGNRVVPHSAALSWPASLLLTWHV